MICYLHVGPHKTATTTMQACLHDNATALSADGLYVPRMEVAGTKTFHHRFAVEMGHGTTTRYSQRIADELRQAGLPSRVIISSENFSAWIRAPDMRNRLAAFFAELGYVLHVIAYIRPQLTAINSYYTQRIKSAHPVGDFDEFFESFLAAPQYNPLWRFQPVAQDAKFTSTFVPFSAETLRGGVCQDFLTRLGVEQAKLSSYSYPQARNVSPGPKTIAAFKRIGGTLASDPQKLPQDVLVYRASGLRRLTDTLGWDKVRFNGLTNQQKLQLTSHFLEPNEAFASQMWKRSWRDVFAADEAKALAEQRCIFHRESANARERDEFDAFCEYAVEVMRRPVGADEKGGGEAVQPSISAVDARALRHQRARRRQRR